MKISAVAASEPSGAQTDPVPARLKINIDDHVDDAARICLYLIRSFADVDTDICVLNRNADEIAPTPCSCRCFGAAPARSLCQQHATKDSYPARRAVAGVRGYLSGVPGIASASGPPALHGMIDSKRPMHHELFHRPDISESAMRPTGPVLRRYGV